jgi:hypothetical protein
VDKENTSFRGDPRYIELRYSVPKIRSNEDNDETET